MDTVGVSSRALRDQEKHARLEGLRDAGRRVDVHLEGGRQLRGP